MLGDRTKHAAYASADIAVGRDAVVADDIAVAIDGALAAAAAALADGW